MKVVFWCPGMFRLLKRPFVSGRSFATNVTRKPPPTSSSAQSKNVPRRQATQSKESSTASVKVNATKETQTSSSSTAPPPPPPPKAKPVKTPLTPTPEPPPPSSGGFGRFFGLLVTGGVALYGGAIAYATRSDENRETIETYLPGSRDAIIILENYGVIEFAKKTNVITTHRRSPVEQQTPLGNAKNVLHHQVEDEKPAENVNIAQERLKEDEMEGENNEEAHGDENALPQPDNDDDTVEQDRESPAAVEVVVEDEEAKDDEQEQGISQEEQQQEKQQQQEEDKPQSDFSKEGDASATPSATHTLTIEREAVEEGTTETVVDVDDEDNDDEEDEVVDLHVFVDEEDTGNEDTDNEKVNEIESAEDGLDDVKSVDSDDIHSTNTPSQTPLAEHTSDLLKNAGLSLVDVVSKVSKVPHPGEVSDNATDAEKLQHAQALAKWLQYRIDVLEESEQHRLRAVVQHQFSLSQAAFQEQIAAVTVSHENELKEQLSLLRNELAVEFEKEKKRVEENAKTSLMTELEKRDEEHVDAMRKELNKQAGKIWKESRHHVSMMEKKLTVESVSKLESMRAKLLAIETIVHEYGARERVVRRMHKLMVASQTLEQCVSKGKPLSSSASFLLSSMGDDPLLATVMNTLPTAATSASSDERVLRADDLQSDLTRVCAEARKVAHVPVYGGMLSFAFSYLVNAVTFAPKGLVEGDDVNAILARAEYFAARNNLEMATRQLNQVNGPAREVVKGWLKSARTHLEVQQAMNVINTYLSILSISLLEE
eukprot:m.25162 g.25162  ORF g.25162 m.25162 type:complete len:770 (+) comp9180_c0_seq1:11-2320(+)